jgi:hypothetical protein
MEQLSNNTYPIGRKEQLNRRLNIIFNPAMAKMKAIN